MCNTTKALHARNLIPFWSVHGRRSFVKLPRALTQGSMPWVKAARVVHALALSQGPAAASLMDAVALPWGQFLLNSMQFLFHKSELKPSQESIDLCYQSSEIPELGSWGNLHLLINISYSLKQMSDSNFYFEPDAASVFWWCSLLGNKISASYFNTSISPSSSLSSSVFSSLDV